MATPLSHFPIAGRRGMDEAIALLRENDWAITGERYDLVTAETGFARIKWNPLTGYLTGEHVTGLEFTHSSSELDGYPWYRELLSYFYTL